MQGGTTTMRGTSTALARTASAGLVLTVPALAGAPSFFIWLAGMAAVALVAAGTRPAAARTAAAGTAIGLERQLARCRRHGHGAELAIVRGAEMTSLLPAIRTTDAVMLSEHQGNEELVLLTDADGVDRRAVEQRLARAAGRAVEITWAAFPADALTLDDLVVTARNRAADLAEVPAATVIPLPAFARRRVLADPHAV